MGKSFYKLLTFSCKAFEVDLIHKVLYAANRSFIRVPIFLLKIPEAHCQIKPDREF